jgi:hypothetical protein
MVAKEMDQFTVCVEKISESSALHGYCEKQSFKAYRWGHDEVVAAQNPEELGIALATFIYEDRRPDTAQTRVLGVGPFQRGVRISYDITDTATNLDFLTDGDAYQFECSATHGVSSRRKVPLSEIERQNFESKLAATLETLVSSRYTEKRK